MALTTRSTMRRREPRMAHTETATQQKMAGVIGFFETPTALIDGMKQVRGAKYKSFDAFTPFPVHGLDAAQGLKRSPLPYVTFVAAIAGCTLGFLLQYWTSAIDWPLNVGGKPFNSWPAFVPVMFELTVLLAGLCTVGAMFALNGLPNTKRKIFDPGITRDKLALFIEAPLDEEEADESREKGFKAFSEGEAVEFLKRAGAKEVRTVYTEGWF